MNHIESRMPRPKPKPLLPRPGQPRPPSPGSRLAPVSEAYLTGVTCEDRPPLPVRPVRREHEGRRPQPQPARPHPATGVAA